MALFGPKSRGVVLIDIGSGSIGGAFAYTRKGEPLVLCYSTRIDIVERADETLEEAMLRTLDAVCIQLVREGAPTFSREAGPTHIEMVVTSIAAPWQQTDIRTVQIAEEHPFVFTRQLMERAVAGIPTAADRVVADRSVVATTLNGYETERPWGKHARKAEMTVLTSTLPRLAAKNITAALRKAFHAHTVELVSFAPVAYAVVSSLYPLHKEYLLLDISGSATEVLLVKNGVVASVETLAQGVRDIAPPDENRSTTLQQKQRERTWIARLHETLERVASLHPLPQTVFMLADEPVRAHLKEVIDSSTVRTLWLSQEPLAIIPLAPEHTAAMVRVRGLAEGDVFLALLAIFYKERLTKG